MGGGYGALDLEGSGVGDMVCGELDGAGVEGGEEGLGKGEFGHCDDRAGLWIWIRYLQMRMSWD